MPPTSSRMHEALAGLLERAELAVAAARDLVEPDLLEPVDGVVGEARFRLQYPEEVLVVALAGGTGSGKSTLFNVITGSDHAETGVSRPTTSQALVGVPARYEGAMESFLDDLGLENRVVQDRWPGLCLIDLPDTDSVETDHRHQVESILPRIDVMVWVVDPIKYRDAALHHRYLKPLSRYQSQWLVVLNQIDQLDEKGLEMVLADLEAALSEDGLNDVSVLPIAAAPTTGPPLGMENLTARLADLTSTLGVLYTRLLLDLEQAAEGLSSALGGSIGYNERAELAVEQAASEIADYQPAAAVDTLTRFIEDLSAEIPPPLGDQLAMISSSIPVEVHNIGLELPAVENRSRRSRKRAGSEGPDLKARARSGIEDFLAPVGTQLAERARAIAVLADLTLSVSAIRKSHSR